MALLVDPPPRDNAAGRPADEPAVAKDAATATLPLPVLAEPEPPDTGAAVPRLAEPPITGGKVEALMGRLIHVLSHSRLARPFPAVALSALGLVGVAFNGLCATSVPKATSATPPVILPLTAAARRLGAPALP